MQSDDDGTSSSSVESGICLTLKGDVFVRYNAYATAEELKRDVKTKSGKIDIGPVF